MKRKFFLLVILFIISGCSKNLYKMNSNDNANNSPNLQLGFLPSETTELSSGYVKFRFILINNTNDRIRFENDMYHDIYIWDSDTKNWEKINEKMTTLPLDGSVTLGSNEDLMSKTIISIIPDIPPNILESSNSIKLKLVVFGYKLVNDEETDEIAQGSIEFEYIVK
jgi:hypothetical protein